MLLATVEDLIRERGAASITINELALAAGMSPSNVYRFFESKEVLYEAIAENWFADKTRIMEEVVESEVPIRQKMNDFFGRRFALMRQRFDAEPELFISYCELGDEHFEVVRGYVDLGDHYLAMIVAEAMEHGYFKGLTIDRTVSLINLMIQPFCNPQLVIQMSQAPTQEKLAQVIDTIFEGMGKASAHSLQNMQDGIRLVS